MIPTCVNEQLYAYVRLYSELLSLHASLVLLMAFLTQVQLRQKSQDIVLSDLLQIKLDLHNSRSLISLHLPKGLQKTVGCF